MHKRIHAIFPTWLVVVALLALFVGERAYTGEQGTRMGFAGVAAAALAVALAVRFKEWAAAGADKKPVALQLLLCTLGVTVGLVLYGALAVVFTEDSASHERIRGVLWATWPAILTCGLFPLVALEMAVMPVAFIPIYERARVTKSVHRALALALFLSCLFVGNYLANRHDTKFELSAGHQAVASEQTIRAVRDLTKEVEVVLFYPRANEVAERVERYFEPLMAANSKLSLRRVDHALAGELAKDAKVTENGYVSVSHGTAHDKIRVGVKARSARSALRRLDGNFIKSVMKVTTSKKVAYFTSGHGERAIGSPDKDDKRTPIKKLKTQLEAWQFTVKELSVANGLADKIPDDAGLVLIMGLEKPFLQAEIDTLKAATKKGVRLLVALDATPGGDALPELLTALGLSYDPTPLANVASHAPLTRSKADRWSIYSNKFSSHASVTTMNRNARRLATVFSKSGALTKVEEGALDRVKTQMVVHGIDGTFADLDGDLEFDADSEKKARYELAAAITRTSTTGKKDDESRIFVLADVDVFADDLVKMVEGNIYMFRDVVLWLKKDAEPVAPTISEEDVKIVHRKKDDALLFYGTTFGVPALVLLLGGFANRRRRKA